MKLPAALGLDVSTAVIGISILDDDADLIELDHIDLRKVKGLWIKAAIVREHFTGLITRHPDLAGARVFVEQNLSGFRPGASSANTILTLARFNGIVSLISHEVFGAEPEYVDFTMARNALGIKTQSKKKCGVEVKHQIWTQVDAQITWPWKYKTLKSGPRKGQTIIDPTQYDAADAWVVARSGLLHEHTIAGR